MASICISTHQSPGVPTTSQRMAFFPRDPMGSHCRMRKYVPSNATMMGSRKNNKKMCRGRAHPAGSVGTGMNGAIPVAGSIQDATLVILI